MSNGWELRLCSGGALTRRPSGSPFEEAAFLLWSCCLGCRFLISCELTKTCVWVATSTPTTPCAGLLPHAWPVTDLLELEDLNCSGKHCLVQQFTLFPQHCCMDVRQRKSSGDTRKAFSAGRLVLDQKCWLQHLSHLSSLSFCNSACLGLSLQASWTIFASCPSLLHVALCN